MYIQISFLCQSEQYLRGATTWYKHQSDNAGVFALNEGDKKTDTDLCWQWRTKYYLELQNVFCDVMYVLSF